MGDSVEEIDRWASFGVATPTINGVVGFNSARVGGRGEGRCGAGRRWCLGVISDQMRVFLWKIQTTFLLIQETTFLFLENKTKSRVDYVYESIRPSHCEYLIRISEYIPSESDYESLPSDFEFYKTKLVYIKIGYGLIRHEDISGPLCFYCWLIHR
ncbi:unnamed protein product [Lactuca virosa]|uniref:Uncharacterized protein n=1 Tax=Lactuca virosa TaxID=75947 RepID=A0AAU9LQM7_9ASTR|nr:unnamed protein product [Lactuca virosa]